MKLLDALPVIENSLNIPFGQLFTNLPVDLKTNKGSVGQLLEKYIGLKLSHQLLDFEDGELKTNKTFSDGRPAETMFITQINRMIDDLISNPSIEFANSEVYKKIKNLLFVSVVKESTDRRQWYFSSVHHVEMKRNSQLYRLLENDFQNICHQLKLFVDQGDKMIHTSSGKFIQIRSKDSRPYRPIFSKIHKRNISNKDHAFYFKKDFMIFIKNS